MAKLLAESVSDIYFVSTDKQKWLLSGYDRNTHPVPIKEITFGLFEAVCKTGLPIQLEYIRNKEDFEACKKMAARYGYDFLCVEFRAPREVLLERFRARVVESEKTGTPISTKTEAQFLENLDLGYYAPPDIPIFDTVVQPPEEIVEKVLGMLVSRAAA
jgi:hypothetical protein